ncbi:hypothetical protein KUV65_15750 [Maritalea mobilis]|uniref:hypothetical protein n=1 Tax=Maritalea mobilis TaxID=483324 RepID=UPI001C976EB5|nr:hypothetical protein [Maritalea mobilis]MBY6202829.1 hypothetical protein [Maritalea mobilis]
MAVGFAAHGSKSKQIDNHPRLDSLAGDEGLVKTHTEVVQRLFCKSVEDCVAVGRAAGLSAGWMLLFKTRSRWWQWALGVAFGICVVILAVSVERSLISSSPEAENLSGDSDILRSEIETMLTFTHVEERPDGYPGPDRILTTEYSARLNDCWLIVTITRPDEAFCRVSENRTRTHIIENNLRFSDEVESRIRGAREGIFFWPFPSGLPIFSTAENASAQTMRSCSGDQSYWQDERYLEALTFPTGSVDGLAGRLIAYRRAVCPTILDYIQFLRP